MNQKDIEINNLIMQEIGLEVGIGNRIIDQDTGNVLTFKGMNVIAPGHYGGHNSIEFDPYNNKKMMSNLFGYFLNKHSEESDIDVLTYYNVDTDNGSRSYIECKLSDNSKLTSKPYTRESLRCTDIIVQLNGGSSPDLWCYDTTNEDPIKRKRSTNNGKNKSNSKTRKNSK